MADATDIPGFMPALAALADWLGDPGDYGMQPRHVAEIVALVMAVSRPYVQAEVLADASDYLAETGQEQLAEVLDNVSAGIRKAVGNV